MEVVVRMKDGKERRFKDLEAIHFAFDHVLLMTALWHGLEVERDEFRIPRLEVEKVEVVL